MTEAPALSAEWSVPADPRQVGIVRRQAATQVAEWGGLPDLVDNVCLLLTELLTNAVEHTNGGSVDTRLTHSEGILEIEVSDLGSGRARLKKPDAQQENGRGLMIVEALALAWGTRPRAASSGKSTWCTLKAEVLGLRAPNKTTAPDIARPEKGSDFLPRAVFSLPRCLYRRAQCIRSGFSGRPLGFAFLSVESALSAALGRAVRAA